MLGAQIPWAKHAKYLSVILNASLNFREHIKTIRWRLIFRSRYSMLNVRSKLSMTCKLRIFIMCIRPIMTYACPVFVHASSAQISRLQVVQNSFLRKALGAPWFLRNERLILTLKQFIKRLSKRYFESAEQFHIPAPPTSAFR